MWDIDPLPSRDVTVAPGAGSWFLESPFSAPRASEGGSLRLEAVPDGMHQLFSLLGQRWRLQVGGEEPLLFP